MQEEQIGEIKYPSDRNCYKILEEIVRNECVIVYKALCHPLNSSVVAIKAIKLDHSTSYIDRIMLEREPMTRLPHPNILNQHCCFPVEDYTWVVMPFMSAGSIQSIIAAAFPDGLSERCITFVLKQTLSALSYLHDQCHVHRDVKAGNILLDSDGSVKLADFQISASVYEPTTSSAIHYWRAPEVGDSRRGYSLKADIWSFGVTALELAHGRSPLILRYPPSKPYKNLSKSFKHMVGLCLVQDPSKRPSSKELLKHSFFKNCGGPEFLVKRVLHGLPTDARSSRLTGK